MIDPIEEVQVAINDVYQLTEGLRRGDVLAHEDISRVLGLEPHEGRWSYIVHKALRRLERMRGIAYWPERTVGYRLLTKADQLLMPTWRLKRAQRQVRRGRKSLMALPEAELTNHQRRVRALTIEGLKEIERSQRNDIKIYTSMSTPTGGVPRRKVE